MDNLVRALNEDGSGSDSEAVWVQPDTTKSQLEKDSSFLVEIVMPCRMNLTIRMEQMTPRGSIVELATANPQLSTLLTAIRVAGLAETLSGEGPFTVFALTNDAFVKMTKGAGLLADKDALTTILLNHIVPGTALASCNLPPGTSSFVSASGESIEVRI